MNESRHIVLYDGICNLCNGAVWFIIKRDHRKLFKFAALQSEIGIALLREMGLPEDQKKSLVYICSDKSYTQSDAVLRVASSLPFPARWLICFRVVPKFVRDAVYHFIAKYRYSLFGKRNVCMNLTPELQSRFLD